MDFYWIRLAFTRISNGITESTVESTGFLGLDLTDFVRFQDFCHFFKKKQESRLDL